ncbi:hypothetical protein JOQ06_025042 [Pogonophryne albipinna]|uniref:Pentraxin (PTX) domain-containing protein n=1 Tax=Pogonophryne albipinna TaxID=1090488 RepID=A0AAD6ATK0_9TELE|nr:hypothetical protein JOQ06_025042 [Pogonophryne albipinna]
MFTFPQQTNTARVTLTTSTASFNAATVCHRSFTDLKRDHILFSMATRSNSNAFLVFWDSANKEMETHIKDAKKEYGGCDYKPGMWHSICSTWDSVTGLVQIWCDGRPSSRMFITNGPISGSTITILGQEQDSHGGGFDLKQSFVGMMSDVHMWDYTLSACEIQKYVDELNFTPGNMLNWSALDFQFNGRMALYLLLLMLTACAATPQDLSGQMFTFPQETNSAHVRLTTSRQVLSAVTVCFRSFSDLRRAITLFSLSTPSAANDFTMFKLAATDVFDMWIRNTHMNFIGQDYKLNTWHSLCSTWDSGSGLFQMWLDGQPSSRRFMSAGSNISGPIIIVLGQDQDSHGGGFDIAQSFVGMMSDVHMWDHVLSPCEIQNYAHHLNLPPGNVLNWNELEFQIIGRVLIEDKQKIETCY